MGQKAVGKFITNYCMVMKKGDIRNTLLSLSFFEL